jgi:hypothetical protein
MLGTHYQRLKKKNEFLTSIVTTGEPQLIDKKAPQITRLFKQQNARILFISSILRGTWKHISDVMEWRMKKLTSLAILDLNQLIL